MLYLLDANVLITANNTYYQIARVPQFWDWLVSCGIRGQVKIPSAIYEEIKRGKDDLWDWLRYHKNALLFDEEVDLGMVYQVMKQGYAPNLNEEEVERVGMDPFLIAYALRDRGGRIVVTTEVSKPTLRRANRRIPDVCVALQVKHCNTFDLNQALNFTT